MKSILSLLLATALCALTAQAESTPKEATALFERYVALGAKFDPALADLYADDAVIKNTRHLADGTKREMALPAPAFKDLVRKAMPIAKQRGDTNKFSDVTFKAEGAAVRVTATRYSELKKYSSPLSLLVGKRDERWLIIEEISESKQ